MKKFLFLLAVSVLFTSCQTDSNTAAGSKPPLVDPKYSIAKDRAELDKLRENIPPEIKKQNDEKALVAELMGELKHEPSVVREKIATVFRKKKELFNKDMTRLREEYNSNEKKKRDEFLKELADDRKDFLARTTDREKRADFFNQQDEDRRNYFAEQKDKREDFESDFREKRKNFDDYIKERTDDINMELKNYILRWNERVDEENKK